MTLTEKTGKCCGSFNSAVQPAAKAPALNPNDVCPCYRKPAPKM
jgi:hypothetical protein